MGHLLTDFRGMVTKILVARQPGALDPWLLLAERRMILGRQDLRVTPVESKADECRSAAGHAVKASGRFR